MELTAVNNRLLEIVKALPQLGRELYAAEYAYQVRFSYLITHSGMGNAQAREAEALTVCDVEGFYAPLLELRYKYKALYQEKDCLIAIGDNLRAISLAEKSSMHT